MVLVLDEVVFLLVLDVDNVDDSVVVGGLVLDIVLVSDDELLLGEVLLLFVVLLVAVCVGVDVS